MRTLAALLVVGAILVGCAWTTDQNRSPGMMIRNLTDATVDVTYHRPTEKGARQELVVELGPGQVQQYPNLHESEGRCLRGTLVATQNGREVARISQPCERIEWRIGDPDGLASSGSPAP